MSSDIDQKDEIKSASSTETSDEAREDLTKKRNKKRLEEPLYLVRYE